jgi:hypothetical protein
LLDVLNHPNHMARNPNKNGSDGSEFEPWFENRTISALEYFRPFEYRTCSDFGSPLYSDFSTFFRMAPPELPTYQDCHELWSKKRRRQLREQLQVEGGSTATAATGASQGGGSPHQTSGAVSCKSGSVISQPSSEKLEENSSQG